MKFKIGDRVRITKALECWGYSQIGKEYTITGINSDYGSKYWVDRYSSSGDSWYVLEEQIESVEEKTKTIKTKAMMIKNLSNAFKRFLSPELQAQVKAGLRNGELTLTDEGKDLLLELISADPNYSKALTTVAEEKIAEAEKNK